MYVCMCVCVCVCVCASAASPVVAANVTFSQSLRTIHIPVVAADILSRTGPLSGEWRLHP